MKLVGEGPGPGSLAILPNCAELPPAGEDAGSIVIAAKGGVMRLVHVEVGHDVDDDLSSGDRRR